MRIFICGQKSFGRAVLRKLLDDGHEIVGIAPPPQDRLADKMVAVAMVNKIPIVSDCDTLLSTDIPDNTQLIISAHSHWMISNKILDKCQFGGIGFHPSLLPRHRGRDAVRWAVHMGDFVTGATVYDLRSGKCDSGDIILQEPLFVDSSWDYHKLWEEIFPVGVRLISEAVKKIESGDLSRKPQEERFATWEPSWERPMLKVNELSQLQAFSDPCSGCERDCEWCTYHFADPEKYHR